MRFPAFGLILCLAMFSAACSDSEPVATAVEEVAQPIPTLTESVQSFYAALSERDFATAEAFVDQEGLVVLSAIESTSSDSLDMSLDKRSQMSANFWTSFVETAIEFESGVSNVSVVEGQVVTVNGEEFQVVLVRDATASSEATWVFHRTDSGWVVDPIATFGNSFAGPVEAWLDRLPEDEHPEAIAAVAERLTSWNVLLQLQEDTESGVAVRAILQRLIPQLEAAKAEASGP